jgi:formiminotetrahydrofolate cyclodeaminase
VTEPRQQRSLLDATVRELLDAFSSATPTPGGGSASALAGAIGAALLTMVTTLPKTRGNTELERAVLAEAAGRLRALRDHLADLVPRDSEAYDMVVSAYRMPKGSAEAQQERKTAIQRALRQATDVPLETARACALGIAESERVAAHASRSATSDVGVALELLRAGLRGAALNVHINLETQEDVAFAIASRRELEELAHTADEAARRTAASLQNERT